MEIEQYLRKLPFWDKLNENERARLIGGSVVRRYAKGEMVHCCDKGCLGMILVLSGGTRTYILSEEGREITLFRLRAGDTCVLSAACVISQITFETEIVADREAELLIIGSTVFGEVTRENIYARCYMYELVTERFSAVMWTMQEILFKGFDRRLAAFLVREYERSGSREIRMTHEEIAQHTSSAREVVARMLKRFAGEGLVEMRRGSTTLTDIEALRELI